jgi:probable F420-dependent oxidoreductase
VSGHLEAVVPFWLDRPDREALDVAAAVSAAGLDGLWIGEMATFDAFALATAVGLRSPTLRLNVGPLPISVRSPAAIALGASTVATLTGCEVNVALGASSPFIVQGWHDREWGHSAARMREAVACLRPMLDGQRSDFDGSHVRSHGFRLRQPMPTARLGIGAFGPATMRLAALTADDLILNLATPQRVRDVRVQLDEWAAAAGRTPPRLTVWVPLALEPGDAALAQVAGQLAVYLAPPGYGEMFTELGFGELVQRARAGVRRAELAATMPAELLEAVGAVGDRARIGQRLRAYRDAGADTVAVVPATADDPAGRGALQCAADELSKATNHFVGGVASPL